MFNILHLDIFNKATPGILKLVILMRGWRGMASVTMLLLAMRPVAGEPRLGKYLCITDYSAGIVLQPNARWAAGPITVAPEKQKFFVTIRAAIGRNSEERRERCFTKQQGEALKYEPFETGEQADKLLERQFVQGQKDLKREEADPSYKAPQALDPQQFVDFCLSNFTADVANEKGLASFDGLKFTSYVTPWAVMFELNPNGQFRLYEESWASLKPLDSNDVVYRGRCELIQPAP